MLRAVLPFAGVALIIAAVLAIALHSYYANRRGALALSADLLEAIQRRVAQEVTVYLDPAARAARVAADLFSPAALEGDAQDALLERFAASLFDELPQVVLFSAGDPSGNYLQLRRGAEAGAIDTKRIRNAPPPRRVVWVRRDATGAVVVEEDPADEFDPRTRPWYEGAVRAGGLTWTDVYVFYTDRVPGVTVSMPVLGADGSVAGVVGLDITLQELSRFLAGLAIGRTGRAFIVDRAGRVIARPDASQVLRTTPEAELQTLRLDELDDPVLKRAFDHFRVEGEPRRTIEVAGHRYILASGELPLGRGQSWFLLVVVPESDFTGFVAANNRIALAISAAVVLLAALMAALLLRQGMKADRAVRLLTERQHAITAQSEAFARLAASVELFDPSAKAPPHALTEELARVTRARRASVWRMAADGRSLRCDDAFDRETSGHAEGAILHRDELPQFFARLAEGESIDTEDAAVEHGTAELHRVWLHPLGGRALLAVPVMSRGRAAGAVWVEDPAPGVAGAEAFLHAVANMLALRVAGAPVPAAVAPQQRRTGSPQPEPPAAKTSLAPEATPALPRAAVADHGLVAELAKGRTHRDGVGTEVYAGVAVMALHIAVPPLSARGQEPHPLLDAVARTLQEIADAHGIGYVRLFGDQVIAAAGLASAEAGHAAATRIANAALETRDRCAALFEECNQPPEFRIGIDLGAAIGSLVGHAPRAFNLWGDAVRTADQMALSAPPGSIQVTEAAHEPLRHDFVFRPRGSFWLPRQGERRIYILAARL